MRVFLLSSTIILTQEHKSHLLSSTIILTQEHKSYLLSSTIILTQEHNIVFLGKSPAGRDYRYPYLFLHAETSIPCPHSFSGVTQQHNNLQLLYECCIRELRHS